MLGSDAGHRSRARRRLSPVRTITSRRSPVVAAFRDAARARRANRKRLLLDGARLIAAAHRAGAPLERAVFSHEALRRRDGPHAGLAERLKADGVEVFSAPAPVLAAVSPVRSPSGAAALALHRPAAAAQAFAGAGLVLALIGVQDPGNLGAIVRAADAGGAAGVLVAGGSADPFGWRALRGAMGGAFRLPVVDAGAADAAIDAARARGATVLAAAPRGGTPVHEADLTGPRLVLVGGEGAGLGRSADRADGRISVPMRKHVESLNAAVAAALIVYEARRQRAAASEPDGAGDRR